MTLVIEISFGTSLNLFPTQEFPRGYNVHVKCRRWFYGSLAPDLSKAVTLLLDGIK